MTCTHEMAIPFEGVYAFWRSFVASFVSTDVRLVVPITCSVPGTPK
jgi:hypothetical protein